MEKYPWCGSIDIDLEKGDGYSTLPPAMFRNIYNTVKGYDSSKLMNICLPGMNSINGSVGGENWCVWRSQRYCDTAASELWYGMGGSAPGAVSPRDWLGHLRLCGHSHEPGEDILHLPAYGWNWQIYDLPANLGKTYRGTSNTYYAAKN